MATLNCQLYYGVGDNDCSVVEYWWTNGVNRLIKTANDDMMIVMAVVTRKKALNQNMEAGH